jgi:hypothetical protein
MPLNPEDLAKLDPILRRAVVRIRVGESEGTGFFVAPSRVLTCYHVVAGSINTNVPIKVTDSTKGEFTATILEQRGPGWPDLAFLDVDAPGAPCPLFSIEPVARGAKLVVTGYVAGSSVPFQSRGMTSGGANQFGDSNEPYLRLDDDPVVPGLSGSPVLDEGTGLVAGIVRLTIDDRIDAGGFAVPMASIIQHIPELRPLYDRPPATAQEWIGALGAKYLKEAKRGADGVRFGAEAREMDRIDLEVSMGTAPSSAWRVSTVKEPANGVEVGVAALGDDVMETVERWSQRQTFGGVEEEKLLGKVLYRALLPVPLKRLVDQATSRHAQVLVRVRVSSSNRLAAIPWEYAREEDSKPPLSTDLATPFSRYVDIASKPVEPAERLRVFGIAQAPKTYRIPGFMGAGGPHYPDNSVGLAKALEKTLAGKGRIDAHVVADYDLGTLDDDPEVRWDVIHYIGLAWDNGELLSKLGNSGFQPVSLDNFARTIAAKQPTVVVLQLLPAPVDSPSPALGLVKILRLLEGGVQAVVVAQHAATDRHISGFNERFYEFLASGESVEAAVQRGRSQLLEQPPYGDSTAFGTVSVTTTLAGNLRLVTLPAQPSRRPNETDDRGRAQPAQGRS